VTPRDVAITSSTEYDTRTGDTRIHMYANLAPVMQELFGSEAVFKAVIAEILRTLSDRIVDEVLQSAAIRARVSQLQAELPSRMEEALVAAITKVVLTPSVEPRDAR
jgi:hypothetical protein